jgi:hypothetical protein
LLKKVLSASLEAFIEVGIRLSADRLQGGRKRDEDNPAKRGSDEPFSAICQGKMNV